MTRRIASLAIALFVILATLVGAAGAKADTPTGTDPFGFEPPTPVGGTKPGYDIGTGDFNRDGRTDLAVTNPSAGQAELLLNTGTAFTHAYYSLTSYVTNLRVADYDRDAIDDVLMLHESGPSLMVLASDGEGGVRGTTNIYPTTGRTAFAVADLNGDGKLDYAMSATGDFVVWFTVTGTNPLTGRLYYPEIANTVGVAIGDVNGDGHADVIATQTGGLLRVLLGDGSGLAAQTGGSPLGGAVKHLTLSDVDGDADLDVVGIDAATGEVVVALGDGDGGFAASRVAVPGGRASMVRVADVDVDGLADLVTANGAAGNVSVFRGIASGGFAAPLNATVGSGDVTSVAVGDFDADTRPDLAVSHGAGSSVLLQAAPRFWMAPASLSFSTTHVNHQSESQTVTVTSTGSVPLEVSAATTSGADADSFVITDDGCAGQTVPKNATCTVKVAFQPTKPSPPGNEVRSLAPLKASLILTTNSQSYVAPLGLSGIAHDPQITVAKYHGDPFKTAVGDTQEEIFVLRHYGVGGVTLDQNWASFLGPDGSVFSTGRADMQPPCQAGTIVDNRNFCYFLVRFSPTEYRSYNATLQIHSNANNGPTVLAVTGVATTPQGVITETNVSLFTSPGSEVRHKLRVNNTSADGILKLTGFTAPAGFRISTEFNCAAIDPGGVCVVVVNFLPPEEGTYSGPLTIASNSKSPMPPIDLLGMAGVGELTITPEPTPQVPLGSSVKHRVRLTNTGDVPVSTSGATLTGGDTAAFTPGGGQCSLKQVFGQPHRLDPGQSCTFNFIFKPTEERDYAAEVSIASSAQSSPQLTTITGKGISADVVPGSVIATPDSLHLEAILGATATRTVTLTNPGDLPVTMHGTSTGGTYWRKFAVSPTGCGVDGFVLAAQASCTAEIQFTPDAERAYSGDATFYHSAGPTFWTDVTLTAAGVVTSKPTLRITASNATLTHGSTPPSITPIYSGFVDGDGPSVLTTAPTCSTTATATSPAGTYPSVCTGATSDDYTVEFVDGTVTVNHAPTALTTKPASIAKTTATKIRVKFTARLTSGKLGVAGKTVSFSLGDKLMCTATTNAKGVATCAVRLEKSLVDFVTSSTTRAAFAGDGSYLASAASADR